MAKKGPPIEDEPAPVAARPFNAPKADSATLQALLTALKAPPPEEPAPRPLSPVEVISGAIIGALDPEGYERQVRPALEERKTEARRSYETAREQRAENIEALAAVQQLEREAESAAIQSARQAESDAMARARFAREMDTWQDEEAVEEDKRMEEAALLQADLATFPSRLSFAEKVQGDLLSIPEGAPGWEIAHEHGRLIGYTIVGIATALGEPASGLAARMQAQPDTVSAQNIAMYRRMLPDLEKVVAGGVAAYDAVSQARLGAMLREKEEPRRLIPASALRGMASNKNTARLTFQALARFKELGKPGGPAAMLGAMTKQQREWRSYLSAATVPLRKEIFGSNLTEGEKQSAVGLLPEIDAMPDTVENGLTRLVEMMKGEYESELEAYESGGYFTGTLAWDIEMPVVPSKLPPGAKAVGTVH